MNGLRGVYADKEFVAGSSRLPVSLWLSPIEEPPKDGSRVTFGGFLVSDENNDISIEVSHYSIEA